MTTNQPAPVLAQEDLVTSIAVGGYDPLIATPWEKVAHRIPDGASPEQILDVAGLNWEVSKLPVFTERVETIPTYGGGFTVKIPIKGSYTCMRMDNHTILSPFLGPRYKLVQNLEAFQAFEQFCLAGNLTIETAGSLSGGRHVWALAALPNQVPIGPEWAGETIRAYFLLAQSHYYGNALRAMFTPIRYPGGHTFIRAVNIKGRKGYYAMPHSREFNAERQEEILLLVERAREDLEAFARDAEFLSNCHLNEKDGVFYLAQVFDPKLIKSITENGGTMPESYDELIEHPKANRRVKEAVNLIPQTPGHYTLPTCHQTSWGLYNTVAHAIDRAMGRGVHTRLESAWFGRNARLKAQALQLALTAGRQGGD